MYPKKQPKSDAERFLSAFRKKVGAGPEEYLNRKLAAGMDEQELQRLYDMLAVEIARKVHCTAIRYEDVRRGRANTAKRHAERAGSLQVPVCEKCGAKMVLRTGQSGPRKGQKYWGCSNYPACRYTKKAESEA